MFSFTYLYSFAVSNWSVAFGAAGGISDRLPLVHPREYWNVCPVQLDRKKMWSSTMAMTNFIISLFSQYYLQNKCINLTIHVIIWAIEHAMMHVERSDVYTQFHGYRREQWALLFNSAVPIFSNKEIDCVNVKQFWLIKYLNFSRPLK